MARCAAGLLRRTGSVSDSRHAYEGWRGSIIRGDELTTTCGVGANY